MISSNNNEPIDDGTKAVRSHLSLTFISKSAGSTQDNKDSNTIWSYNYRPHVLQVDNQGNLSPLPNNFFGELADVLSENDLITLWGFCNNPTNTDTTQPPPPISQPPSLIDTQAHYKVVRVIKPRKIVEIRRATDIEVLSILIPLRVNPVSLDWSASDVIYLHRDPADLDKCFGYFTIADNIDHFDAYFYEGTMRTCTIDSIDCTASDLPETQNKLRFVSYNSTTGQIVFNGVNDPNNILSTSARAGRFKLSITYKFNDINFTPQNPQGAEHTFTIDKYVQCLFTEDKPVYIADVGTNDYIQGQTYNIGFTPSSWSTQENYTISNIQDLSINSLVVLKKTNNARNGFAVITAVNVATNTVSILPFIDMGYLDDQILVDTEWKQAVDNYSLLPSITGTEQHTTWLCRCLNPYTDTTTGITYIAGVYQCVANQTTTPYTWSYFGENLDYIDGQGIKITDSATSALSKEVNVNLGSPAYGLSFGTASTLQTSIGGSLKYKDSVPGQASSDKYIEVNLNELKGLAQDTDGSVRIKIGNTLTFDANGALQVNPTTNSRIGMIWQAIRTSPPLDSLRCDGSWYDFADYPELLLAIQQGLVVCNTLAEYQAKLDAPRNTHTANPRDTYGVFGWDGGTTTTFRVPKLDNRVFLAGGIGSQVGWYDQDQIVNIWGSSGYNYRTHTPVFQDNSSGARGAFSQSYNTKILTANSGSVDYVTNLEFNAARVVPTGERVQPMHVQYPVFVVVR